MLKAYVEARNIRLRAEDELAWLQGRYVFDAVSIALANAFRGKAKAAVKYNEKPYSQMEGKDGSSLTEEQKKQYVDALFNRLEIMKFNFEMEKKSKTNDAAAE